MQAAAQITFAHLATAPNLTLWRGGIASDFTSGLYSVEPFDRAVLSWNASGAARFELQAGGAWHTMGLWGEKPASTKSAAVDVDVLSLPVPAPSFRFRVVPEPGTEISLVAVAHWLRGEKRVASADKKRSPAWGKILSVPERSQLSESADARRLCSPTSLAMALEFHGFKKSTREIAAGVYDHAAKIFGNWPFNTAHAHRVSGLEAYVRRGTGIEDLEAEIAAGRPVIISHSWKPGDLDNAPLPASNGHLIVVAGFADSGDIVANDPAGKPGDVRRVYPRVQFFKTWLENAAGIMYVIQ